VCYPAQRLENDRLTANYLVQLSVSKQPVYALNAILKTSFGHTYTYHTISPKDPSRCSGCSACSACIQEVAASQWSGSIL
jgi:hypothetical protein